MGLVPGAPAHVPRKEARGVRGLGRPARVARLVASLPVLVPRARR